MKKDSNRIRPIFLAIVVAVGISVELGGAYIARIMKERERTAEYAAGMDLVSERVSWELSLFFERFYTGTGIVLHELPGYANAIEAAAGLGSPYVQSKLRAVYSRMAVAIAGPDGGTRLAVMGEICPQTSAPGSVYFDDVVARNMGDSSGIAVCADGEEFFILVRRVDSSPWPGRSALVVNIPVGFFNEIIQRNAGFRFAVHFALVDMDGRTMIRQNLRGTSSEPPREIPPSLAEEIAGSGGTRQVDASGFIGSSRQISGYPATIVVLADRKELKRISREKIGPRALLLFPLGAVIALLGAMAYEKYRLARYRATLYTELQRETDFRLLLQNLRDIFYSLEDEDVFIRQAMRQAVSAVPGLSYVLSLPEGEEAGGPPDPGLGAGDSEDSSHSAAHPAAGEKSPPRHYLSALIENPSGFRGRLFIGVDDRYMSRTMTEQLRYFLSKQYMIKASYRKLALSLAEKEEMLDELRRWQCIMLGREERIMELKCEVNRLLREAGLPLRYENEACT